MGIYFQTGSFAEQELPFRLAELKARSWAGSDFLKTSPHSGHTYCSSTTDENMGCATLGDVRNCEILVKSSGKLNTQRLPQAEGV